MKLDVQSVQSVITQNVGSMNWLKKLSWSPAVVDLVKMTNTILTNDLIGHGTSPYALTNQQEFLGSLDENKSKSQSGSTIISTYKSKRSNWNIEIGYTYWHGIPGMSIPSSFSSAISVYETNSDNIKTSSINANEQDFRQLPQQSVLEAYKLIDNDNDADDEPDIEPQPPIYESPKIYKTNPNQVAVLV